jgi:hypothetical protein
MHVSFSIEVFYKSWVVNIVRSSCTYAAFFIFLSWDKPEEFSLLGSAATWNLLIGMYYNGVAWHCCIINAGYDCLELLI